MAKNLVIVESPAKAKTIEKFLGEGFTVKSSFGHIRDLAKGDSAIDIEKGYLPNYIVSTDKKKIVSHTKNTRSSTKIGRFSIRNVSGSKYGLLSHRIRP